MNDGIAELMALAAHGVVEEGLDYGQAKRRAAQQLAGGRRVAGPDNDQLEAAVFAHLRLFHAETQPGELQALRQTALAWMQRLQAFRPHLCGAVWRGTATRISPIHLQLFADDPKSAEWFVLDLNRPYEVVPGHNLQGEEAQALMLWVPCEGLGEEVPLVLTILDWDDLRGALKPDAKGRARRGDEQALMRLLEEHHA